MKTLSLFAIFALVGSSAALASGGGSKTLGLYSCTLAPNSIHLENNGPFTARGVTREEARANAARQCADTNRAQGGDEFWISSQCNSDFNTDCDRLIGASNLEF